MSGGQINVITKSGSNQFAAAPTSSIATTRSMRRTTSTSAASRPSRAISLACTAADRSRAIELFYFVGYEGLRENLGRTITSSVPDENARRGLLPDPANPGQFLNVGVDAAVAPYLDEYPLPNGDEPRRWHRAAQLSVRSASRPEFFPGPHRLQPVGPTSQFFARYTLDDADQRLPLDYPQFPRAFRLAQPVLTAETKQTLTANLLGTYRVGYSRTRVGQAVEANTALPPFVPGRAFIGNIDVGGLQRFGTQSSVDVRFLQQVYQLAARPRPDARTPPVQRGRARRALSAGHGESDLQPWHLLLCQPARVYGEPRDQLHRPDPRGQFDRHGRSGLPVATCRTNSSAHPRLTITAGLRYEFMTHADRLRAATIRRWSI